MARVPAPGTHRRRSKRFKVLDAGTPPAGRANCRSEERAASPPLPAPCGRWGLSSALRLRRATRPTSRRAASGLGRESHDEPKVQRTRSMTGNVAIETKLAAEGYGGQSGSAYRRSGRFTYRESTRATGPAQAPARICPKKKRRHKNARRPQRHTAGRSPAQQKMNACQTRSRRESHPRPVVIEERTFRKDATVRDPLRIRLTALPRSLDRCRDS